MNEPWLELVFGVPVDGTEIWLRTKDGHEFRARYEEGFINSSNQDCGTWVATTDDYPACWTDGAFWEHNEDGKPSVAVTRWKPVAPLHGDGTP